MRKCSITGETITSGFVVQQGEMYFGNENDLREHLNSIGYDFDEAYKDEYFYWTEFN